MAGCPYCGNQCTTYCGTSCNQGCAATCSNVCKNGCSNGCENTCYTGCSGGCKNGCGGRCSNDCWNACTGTCQLDCTYDCSGGCYGGCKGSCSNYCAEHCSNNCTGSCHQECADDCTGGCKGGCEGSCTGSCTTTCTATCKGTNEGQSTSRTITYYTHDGTVIKTDTLTFSSTYDLYRVAANYPERTGYKFDGWVRNDGVKYNHGDYMRVEWTDGDFTFTAHYTLITLVTVQVENDGNGEVYAVNTHTGYANTSITISLQDYNPVRYTFRINSVNPNYEFDYLEDANGNRIALGSIQERYMGQGGTYVYYAHFKRKEVTLTIVKKGIGEGWYTGSGTYVAGTTALMQAYPDLGSAFQYWVKDGQVLSASPSYGFTITEDCTVECWFRLSNYTISVNASPDEGGTVTGGGNYLYGDTCNLYAYANTSAGYRFRSWSNGSTSSHLSFIVRGDASYTAYFTNKPFHLDAYANPAEGGTVTVSDGGDFYIGEAAVLQATPNEGWVFTGWSNGHKYPFQVLDIEEDTPHTIYANFRRGSVSYNVYTQAIPEHAGEINGEGRYVGGSEAIITAYPSELHKFDYWEYNGSDTNPLVFTVLENTNIIGYFIRWPNVFVGDNRVKKICLGDTELRKVTVGDTDVYLE